MSQARSLPNKAEKNLAILQQKQLEVEFNVDVYFPNEDCYRTLGEISPVVSTLARQQFDDYVKRVRVFVHPQLLNELRHQSDLTPTLEETIRRMD